MYKSNAHVFFEESLSWQFARVDANTKAFALFQILAFLNKHPT